MTSFYSITPLVRCLGSLSSTLGKLSGEVSIFQLKSDVHF